MKKRTDDVLETPITPMIDVVFQLIIFFVVSAAQQQELIDDTILLAKVKDVTEVPTSKSATTVTINVNEAGRINIGNVPMSKTELTNVLKETRSRYGNNVPIVIRCDGTANFEHIDNVMRAVGAAGLYKIQLSATPSK